MMSALKVSEKDIIRFVTKEVGYIPAEAPTRIPLNTPIFLRSSEGLYEVVATDVMYLDTRWMMVGILTISSFKMVL